MQSEVWNPDLVRVGTLEEEAREECRNLEEASHGTMRKKEREKEKRKKRKRKKKREERKNGLEFL